MREQAARTAKIHILRTTNQAWMTYQTGPATFELWAARQPDAPDAQKGQCIAQFESLHQTEWVASALNQLWHPLLRCQEIAGSIKSSANAERVRKAYDDLQTEIDHALHIATQSASSIFKIESSLIRQLFSLIHRTIRDCSGIAVHHQKARSLRDRFTGLLRIQRTIHETSRQIKRLYEREC